MRRTLHRLRRNPTHHWLAVTVAAVVAAQLTLAGGQDTNTETSTAWVSATDLLPGTLITADDVARREVPKNVVPTDASTEDPAGASVGERLASGEIVVEGRLDRVVGPPDRRLIGLRSDGMLALEPGDRVQVAATPDGGPLPSTATILVSSALVVSADSESVVLSVDELDALALAAHRHTSWLTLLQLSGPPEPESS